MASDIQTLLNNIMNAIYGRDVRSSIHDAIEMCYDDVSSGKTTAESAASSATTAASAANTAATNATTATTNANTATSAANTAASAANTAASNANDAADDANDAADAANTAATAANSAATSATTAASSANSAATSATTAASSANTAATNATTATTNATNAASAANTAAGNANTATSTANQAASNADAKASLANTAANAANTATTAANLATSNANAATDAANTAATNANTARDSANSAASSATTAATNATTAANAANTAATTANSKILDMDERLSDAATAISDANSAAYNANVATTSANKATTRANTAAESIENLTVDSEEVGPSGTASATLQTVNDHKNIHFVLKQGKTGASFVIKGSAYASVAALEADITDPEEGDQYNVGTSTPYNVYRWTGSSWEDQGTIGSAMDPITATDVQTIQDGGTIENPTQKVMKVEALTYLLQTLLVSLLGDKVDKVSGKGLSTNDFTDAYVSTIDTLEDNVTVLGTSKVDKVTGKGLSTNDFTTALRNKVLLIGDDTLATTASTIIAAINELNTLISGLSSNELLIGTYYGVSNTAAATQVKEVTISGITALSTGLKVCVQFGYAQTYSGAPQLNLNSLGGVEIRRSSGVAAAQYEWQAGQVITFVFNGSYWIINDGMIADTAYYGKTRLTSSLTSTSAGLALTAAAGKTLQDQIDVINAAACLNLVEVTS